MSQAVLEALNVSLFLRQGKGELKIVDALDLRVERGQFSALIGESGSGKTMFARAIMRLLPPQKLKVAGRLSAAGIDVAHADEKTMRELRGRSIGMIFQEPMSSLNPIMTIGDQIEETIAVHQNLSAAKRRDKVLRLLEDVRFPAPAQVAAQYPHELSGGMRQRAIIAIALANDPALLIADEPTTALDVTTQKDIIEIIKRLQKSHGLAVLYISHDIALVSKYADTISVLYAGSLMESGVARDVIAAPAHPYTSALLECMPGPRVGDARQSGIPGSVPRVDDWFEGCRFAPRCKFAQPECVEAPVRVTGSQDGRMVKCLFPLH